MNFRSDVTDVMSSAEFAKRCTDTYDWPTLQTIDGGFVFIYSQTTMFVQHTSCGTDYINMC